MPSYRSSSSLVLIDPYFTELWPLDLENFINCQFSALFFSLLADIHLIFGTLLCHTKLQISSSFVSIDSFFTELWSLSYPGFTINMIDIAYIMRLEYCCSPIIFVIGRGLCIAMQYSQNACYYENKLSCKRTNSSTRGSLNLLLLLMAQPAGPSVMWQHHI